MRRIVAIGGGEIRTSETYEIDAHIVGLTKKKSPTALFIPTASDDSEGYWAAFQSVYGDGLGCVTQVLLLQKRSPDQTTARETILNADLIYVGGGNTLRLMRTWRRHRIDVVLEEAADKGVVLSGVSAGAMCWFKYGNRLPPSAGESDHGAYVRLRGLGLVDGLFCPHHNSEPRARSLRDMISEYGGMGLGVDDNSAIEIAGDTFRVLSSDEDAGVRRVYKRSGKVVTEIVQETEVYQPIRYLLEKSRVTVQI